MKDSTFTGSWAVGEQHGTIVLQWHLWPSNLERLPWSIRDELRNDQPPHDYYGATVQAAAAGNSAVLLVLPMRPYEAQTTLKKTMACRLAW